MPPPIPPPSPRHLLPPLLASIPAAAISPKPPTALLPLLSPILRQRVQILAAGTQDPWLPLLCYDPEGSGKLSELARSDRFEPHPVSGEIEVDWHSEVDARFRRIDEETLEAYVSLQELELDVKLLWCVGDLEGGGDGWRVGEVRPLNEVDHARQGWESIGKAEGRFKEVSFNETISQPLNGLKTSHATTGPNKGNLSSASHGADEEEEEMMEEEEDDDAYWAQYDSTPARTPAPKASPAPDSMNLTSHVRGSVGDEEAYYAQYASVQPAMDAHDPDEASPNSHLESSLGAEHAATRTIHSPSQTRPEVPLHNRPELAELSTAWRDSPLPAPTPSTTTTYVSATSHNADPTTTTLAHPQPRPLSSSSSSSSSSGASTTIEKLESTVAVQMQAEVGIKQHISTSIKSMFRLARAVGVDRDEFDRLVRTELDCLSMMEDDVD